MSAPFIDLKGVKAINVPHAAEVMEEVVAHDCYELESLGGGWALLDCGAFYGEASMYACKLGMKCVAIEPSEKSFKILSFNKALNLEDPHDCIAIRACIAANRASTVPHYYNPGHPAGSGGSIASLSTMETPMGLTMMDAVGLLKANHPTRKLAVKMDIEGAERDAFASFNEWLPLVSFVAMETHNHDAQDYAEILEANGFDVKVTGTGFPPRVAWDSSMAGGLVIARRKA